MTPENCELCNRSITLTFHHLIPKKVHKRRDIQEMFSKEECQQRGLWVCTDCHSTIHRTLDHKDLGLVYNSREKLLEHEGISKFVTWVAKQRKKAKR